MSTFDEIYQAKYVSRDINPVGINTIDFNIRIPDWRPTFNWWVTDDQVTLLHQAVSEFLEENGWCPEPGEAYEIEWLIEDESLEL